MVLSNQPGNTHLDQFFDGGDVEERYVMGSQSVHVLHLYQAPVVYLFWYLVFRNILEVNIPKYKYFKNKSVFCNLVIYLMTDCCSFALATAITIKLVRIRSSSFIFDGLT